jgi:hypothetical protein
MIFNKEEIDELRAVECTTNEIQRPTFIHVLHRKGVYKRLISHRLVTWAKFTDGTFGPSFRSVELTDKGRDFLRSVS